MPITARQLKNFVREVREAKAAASAPPPPEAPGTLHLAPLDLAILVLVLVGWLSPEASQRWLSPGMTTFVLVAYVGHKLLERQRKAHEEAANKAANGGTGGDASSSAAATAGGSLTSKPSSSSYSSRSKSSSSSSASTAAAAAEGKIVTRADLLADQARLRAKASSSSKDVRAATSKTQYFLTMNGPGQPALVPFPRGFKARPGAPDGTMWWDNARNLDLQDIMVQPPAPGKSSREERKEKEATKHVQPPGTLPLEEIKARIPLEREMERYEKAIVVMQCALALLLCFVDERLGLVLLALFLFLHYRTLREREAEQARNVAALPPGTANPYEAEDGDSGAGLGGGGSSSSSREKSSSSRSGSSRSKSSSSALAGLGLDF